MAQSGAAQIACPMCDSRAIRKMPSAPRLNLSGAMQEKSDVTLMQQQLLDAVRKLVASTEDVGERFAEEARRIHYNEAPDRAIRGLASAAEYVALAEEGIDVVPLPIPAPLKQTLQ